MAFAARGDHRRKAEASGANCKFQFMICWRRNFLFAWSENSIARTQPNSSRRRSNLSFRFARYPVLSLAGFLTLGALRISAAPADTIYLESNSTAGNSIFTYTFNFTSAPVLKSATPAGGIGVFDSTFALGPFDSDQNLIENASGTLLFAVNSGSNNIAVFNIHPDGSLSPVHDSPFPSGGTDPVSVGLNGN